MAGRAAQAVLARMWWGPLRRPMEAAARRLFSGRGKILSGPLRGVVFEGGLAQRLGIYELAVQQAFWRSVGVGDVVFDVGAHRGFFSLLGWRKVGSAGRVIACEPNPAVVAFLRSNIEINSASAVKVVEAAVAEKEAPVRFLAASGGSSAEGHLAAECDVGSDLVEGVTLDALVRRFEAPSLVKIDVEGFAARVLRGGSALLSGAAPPVLLIEIHSGSEEAECGELTPGWSVETVADIHPGYRSFPRHVLVSPPNSNRGHEEGRC